MNIIQHGNLLNKTVERFTCNKCGCVFDADEDEFWVSDSLVNPFWSSDKITVTSFTYTLSTERRKFCNCPVCHAKCEKTEIISNLSDKVEYTKVDVGDYPLSWSATNGKADGVTLT